MRRRLPQQPPKNGNVDDTATPDDGGTDSIEVNETFWHADYEVELGTATLADDIVRIDGVFKNLGQARNAAFDSLVTLRSGGNEYQEAASLEQDLPALGPKAQKTGNFAILVEDGFSFDDAVLIIGNPDNNQAIIPLGPNSGETLRTLEPEDLTITGRAVAGPVTVDLESGEIRADLPDRYSIADKDHLELTLRFSVTPGSGITVGQGVFQSPNVKLKTPDGDNRGARGRRQWR